jgi:hypothetical protein
MKYNYITLYLINNLTNKLDFIKFSKFRNYILILYYYISYF